MGLRCVQAIVEGLAYTSVVRCLARLYVKGGQRLSCCGFGGLGMRSGHACHGDETGVRNGKLGRIFLGYGGWVRYI